VSWSLPLSKLWHPAPPNGVRVRPEAISGTPLLEQEFALREATVGKGLEGVA